MPEISPPNALQPAARTVPAPATNTLTKTNPSVSFKSLLGKPPLSAHWAHGPTLEGAAIKARHSATEPTPEDPQGLARRRAEDPQEPGVQELRDAAEPLLDPLWCQFAIQPELGTSSAAASIGQAPSAALPVREDLQNLLTSLARRTAWGGDRRRGTARIELSEGALAGATLVVHAVQRTVSVELELPEGAAGAGARSWQQRIAERLEGRGFSAKVEVG